MFLMVVMLLHQSTIHDNSLFISFFDSLPYDWHRGLSFRFDLQPGAKPKVGSGDKDETVLGLLSNLSLEGLGPHWSRPIPPRLPVQDDEVRHQGIFLDTCVPAYLFTWFIIVNLFQLVWLNPVDNHELLWDDGMCVDTSRGAAVRDLIAKALKGPLVPAQQEVLIKIYVLFMDILNTITGLNICRHVSFYVSVLMLN